jgi:hypothetical protein
MKPDFSMTDDEFIEEISRVLDKQDAGMVLLTENLFTRKRWLNTSDAAHIYFGRTLARLVMQKRVRLEFANGDEAVQRYIAI